MSSFSNHGGPDQDGITAWFYRPEFREKRCGRRVGELRKWVGFGGVVEGMGRMQQEITLLDGTVQQTNFPRHPLQ
jgi:hypothetical protein